MVWVNKAEICDVRKLLPPKVAQPVSALEKIIEEAKREEAERKVRKREELRERLKRR